MYYAFYYKQDISVCYLKYQLFMIVYAVLIGILFNKTFVGSNEASLHVFVIVFGKQYKHSWYNQGNQARVNRLQID